MLSPSILEPIFMSSNLFYCVHNWASEGWFNKFEV